MAVYKMVAPGDGRGGVNPPQDWQRGGMGQCLSRSCPWSGRREEGDSHVSLAKLPAASQRSDFSLIPGLHLGYLQTLSHRGAVSGCTASRGTRVHLAFTKQLRRGGHPPEVEAVPFHFQASVAAFMFSCSARVENTPLPWQQE